MAHAQQATMDAAGRRMLWPGAIALGLCGIVFVEPAPADVALIAFIPFALLLGRPALHRRLSIVLAAITVFLTTNLVSVVMADDPGSTLRFLAITAYLVATCVTLILLLTRHRLPLARHYVGAYAVGITATAAISLAAYFGLLPLEEWVSPRGRVRGFFKDPNVFGAALVPAIVFAVAKVAEPEGRRAAWVAIAIICMSATVLSYSRGAWVNAALTLPAFYTLRFIGNAKLGHSVRMLLGFCILMLVLVPVLWQLTDLPAVQEMLKVRVRYQSYDDNRFGTQAEALLAAIEHPLGIGPGLSESTFGRATHSLFVRSLIENGFVGLLAMVLILLASVGRATWASLVGGDAQTRQFMAVIAGVLWGLTAESFVIDTVHWRHFWIFVALAWVPPAIVSHRVRPSSARGLDPVARR